MADPILLPDCPELRARAEAIARARYAALLPLLRPLGFMPYSWDDPAFEARACFVDAAFAELRDLSTDIGRDQGCRWLWELLTGEDPAWCPAWHRRMGVGFRISMTWKATEAIDFIPPGPADVSGTFYADSNYVALADANTFTWAEGLRAAITAALDWRRGVSNG